MPTLDIKVEFSDDLAKKMLDANTRVLNEVDKALLAGAILIEGQIKKKISRGGRGGGTHRVGRRTAVRSAPGEPPKSDTGRLVGSITHQHSFLSATVGTEVNYAGYLEFGTSKMAERPYLRPTLEENQDTIERMIIDAMQRAMG
jgi:HK97 gp10 family phage protein